MQKHSQIYPKSLKTAFRGVIQMHSFLKKVIHANPKEFMPGDTVTSKTKEVRPDQPVLTRKSV
jgi:hypothetical protein